MKYILAVLAVALVLAAENFFYDHHGAVILYRTDTACYVRAVTAEEQATIHDHDAMLALEASIRAAVAAGHYVDMPFTEHTDFETHHCHDREVYRMTQ